MKITRDKMFFSKDLIHTLAYVGMFVAAIISVGACKSGIWVAAILAWIVAGIIIGLAIISDYKKAELLKNGTRIIGKVTATKRVHIKFHMSTYHLADEDVIYPYVVHYQYKVKGETYNGKSQWFWFNILTTPLAISNTQPVFIAAIFTSHQNSLLAFCLYNEI